MRRRRTLIRSTGAGTVNLFKFQVVQPKLSFRTKPWTEDKPLGIYSSLKGQGKIVAKKREDTAEWEKRGDPGHLRKHETIFEKLIMATEELPKPQT